MIEECPPTIIDSGGRADYWQEVQVGPSDPSSHYQSFHTYRTGNSFQMEMSVLSCPAEFDPSFSSSRTSSAISFDSLPVTVGSSMSAIGAMTTPTPCRA